MNPNFFSVTFGCIPMLRASDYQDRFHDFSRRAKTVETVPNFFLLFCTRLKPDVNERFFMRLKTGVNESELPVFRQPVA